MTMIEGDRVLVLTRLLNAPRELVFKVWVEPGHLVRWWGPNGFTTPSCKMDVRPGGAYRFVMRSPEGTEHRLRGVYKEIAPPECLVTTWAWEDEKGQIGPETLLTITLEEQGTKTRLTLRQKVFESVTARDAHRHGWTEALERLVAYVAGL